MALIQNSVSIAAGATVDNILTGSQWEFLPFNAHLNFGLVAAAAGLLIDAYSGSDTLVEQMAPSIANRFPIFPDDFTLEDVAGAGERIKVRAQNPTAGALVLFYAIRITPI